MANLNAIDYFILTVLAISVLAGLLRGLVKEIISLLTWIAAFFVSTYFASSLAASFSGSQQVQSMMSSAGASTVHVSLLSLGISYVALFVGTLLAGSLINYFISSAVDTGGVSFANRILGGVFGLIRGILILFVMIFLIQLSPIGAQPVWMQSQFVTAFQPAVKWLDEIVQPGLASIKDKVGDTLKNVNTQDYIDGAQKAWQGVTGGGG